MADKKEEQDSPTAEDWLQTYKELEKLANLPNACPHCGRPYGVPYYPSWSYQPIPTWPTTPSYPYPYYYPVWVSTSRTSETFNE